MNLLLRYAICAALASQTATFRASTRLVDVNVLVHDKNGPVANLAKDDFAITDRGKPRAISAFSMNTANRVVSSGPLPENVYSNRSHSASGAVTIVLLDGLNTFYYGTQFIEQARGPQHFEDQALAFAKAQLMKFVKDLNPKDRVAVYALGTRLHVLCDFTNDSAQLEKVIREYREAMVTQAEVADPAPSDFHEKYDVDESFDVANDAAAQKQAQSANASRASLTIAALMAIANHAADVPGRKNLIWLTARPPVAGEAIGRILSRANLAIYPVDARGLLTSFDPHFHPEGQDTMLQLAEASGGRAFLNNNDVAGAIRKAADDAEVSYTLGFYIEDDSLDGKFHELKIRVDRPGLDVRYPAGYYAVKDEATAAARQREMRSVLKSPIDSAAIHILARMDREAAVLRLGGAVDLHDVRLSESAGMRKGTVELFIFEQDAQGGVLRQMRRRLDLALNPQQYQLYLKSGVLFRENFEPRRGTATVRILAGDPASAAMGSLTIPVSLVK